MQDGALLGLDLGGGSVRALALDVSSGRVAVAARSHRHPAAPGTAGLGVDLDLERLWGLLGLLAREAVSQLGAAPEAVRGVAVSSTRFATVLLGTDGEPLLATPNRDARAGLEALRLSAEHGAALHARTGHWPSPIGGAARLLWLARTSPGALERAHALLGLGDWVTWKLCGLLAPERTQAPSSMLWDVTEGRWARDWIHRLGLPQGIFHPVVAPGHRAGELLPEAAARLGLPAGIPVGVGASDTPCGLLGAGVSAAGEACIVAGTTTPVQVLVGSARVDPEGRLWTEHHAVSGCWALDSNAGATGEVLEWFARLLHPGAARPVVRLLGEAACSAPGAAGLVSHLGASVMDARDLRLPLGALTLSHFVAAEDEAPRRHLARAVVEGMACAVRANLAQAEAAAGLRAERVSLAGGLTRSSFFTRLLADVLGRPLYVAETAESSALGAALCAGVAAGVFSDPGAAAASPLVRTRPVAPDPHSAERYDGLYDSWLALYRAHAEGDAIAARRMLPEILAPLAAAGAPPAPRLVRPRILVTADLDEGSLEALAALGEVEATSFRTALRLLTGPALVEALQGAEVFVTEVDVLDAASLAALPGLRVVVACRGDAVNVDVAACTAFGVPVLHAPGRNAAAVADLTLAFLLALARRLPEAMAFLRRPDVEAGDLGRMGQAFRTLRGGELWRRKVGLVGLGAVGRAVAARLEGFGAEVLVHDPYVPASEIEALGAVPVALDVLLAESDFVSLHAKESVATRGLLGAREIGQMKPGAFLVNTARASLVDEAALVAALREGRLGGAALDVFAVEPPGADHPLVALPNVLATPHVGGNTEEVPVHQGALVVAELGRFLRGESCRHVLNPAVLEGYDATRPRPAPDPRTLASLAAQPGPSVTGARTAPAAPARGPEAPSAVATAATGSAAAAAPGSAAADARRRMERILASFCARVASDEQVRSLSRGRTVTLHFALPDLDLGFHLALADGRAAAAPGPAAAAPDVRLRMKARVLDGLFTGRTNGMDAALRGELFFTGDAARAMTLQHLQADLERLYRLARDEVGGPGDLEALVAAAPAVSAGTLASGDPRRELCRIVAELHATGLVTSTGGNVSVRDPDGETLWITPGQRFKGDLQPESMVRIGLDGEPLDADAGSPSSERLMHCAAYAARPEARAVVHAHAPNATILANAGLPFLPISTEAAFLAEIPRVPFLMPGTKELADAVAAALADGPAVLMQNHGLLVAGRSLRRAADLVEIVERTSEILLGCRAVGAEPPLLPEEVVRELRRAGDLVA